MNAHLVGAPGFQPAFDQRGGVQRFQRLVMGDRVLAARPSSTSAIFLRLADERAMRAAHRAGGRRRDGRRRPRDRRARSNGRRTGGPALHARRRSWRRPAGPRCPCRCGGRCPGRATPPMPESWPRQWCSSALTSVPSRLPAAGWTTSPAGLSTTIRCSSSKTMISGISCACGLGGHGRGNGDGKGGAFGGLERGLAGGLAGQRDPAFAQQRLDPLARQAAGLGQRLVEPLAACGDHAFDDAFPHAHG